MSTKLSLFNAKESRRSLRGRKHTVSFNENENDDDKQQQQPKKAKRVSSSSVPMTVTTSTSITTTTTTTTAVCEFRIRPKLKSPMWENSRDVAKFIFESGPLTPEQIEERKLASVQMSLTTDPSVLKFRPTEGRQMWTNTVHFFLLPHIEAKEIRGLINGYLTLVDMIFTSLTFDPQRLYDSACRTHLLMEYHATHYADGLTRNPVLHTVVSDAEFCTAVFGNDLTEQLPYTPEVWARAISSTWLHAVKPNCVRNNRDMLYCYLYRWFDNIITTTQKKVRVTPDIFRFLVRAGWIFTRHVPDLGVTHGDRTVLAQLLIQRLVDDVSYRGHFPSFMGEADLKSIALWFEKSFVHFQRTMDTHPVGIYAHDSIPVLNGLEAYSFIQMWSTLEHHGAACAGLEALDFFRTALCPVRISRSRVLSFDFTRPLPARRDREKFYRDISEIATKEDVLRLLGHKTGGCCDGLEESQIAFDEEEAVRWS